MARGGGSGAATAHKTHLAPGFAAPGVPGKQEGTQAQTLRLQIQLPPPDSLQPGWINQPVGSWLPPHASTLTSLGRDKPLPGSHSAWACPHASALLLTAGCSWPFPKEPREDRPSSGYVPECLLGT